MGDFLLWGFWKRAVLIPTNVLNRVVCKVTKNKRKVRIVENVSTVLLRLQWEHKIGFDIDIPSS